MNNDILLHIFTKYKRGSVLFWKWDLGNSKIIANGLVRNYPEFLLLLPEGESLLLNRGDRVVLVYNSEGEIQLTEM